MISDTPSTIAAIASPMGVGAISIIRVSGPQALTVAELVSGGYDFSDTPRFARRCKVFAQEGSLIDDGIITFFRGPNSFTGEDTFEFTGHGGILVTREVLSRILECGATHASPGEFSQRAFLNGKLDLTQAEGIMDLISAQTRLAMRAAHSQLEGNLGKKTTEARDDLLGILAHVEAWIDFPDEDIDPQTNSQLTERIQQVIATTEALLSTAEQGRILREGVRTVIFGQPNVGKSSLLNHLLGFERAIVSDTAGTTRDTIEEVINLNGIPLRLVDTAGVRESSDQVESQGIERTVRQIEDADLLIEVVDASKPSPEHTIHTPKNTCHLLVLNKSDLGEHPSWSKTKAIRISCTKDQGFDSLSEAVRSILQFAEADFGEHSVAINARHQASLKVANSSLKTALLQFSNQTLDPEIASIDLREALDALGEIPGKVDTEDLLGMIFSEFCIGK
ncbi:MAG: tRNA uridine-5-carboxymethylaminomethyl(34) synthesis GTPase MnmE [Akkermansiaceae bacterium]